MLPCSLAIFRASPDLSFAGNNDISGAVTIIDAVMLIGLLHLMTQRWAWYAQGRVDVPDGCCRCHKVPYALHSRTKMRHNETVTIAWTGQGLGKVAYKSHARAGCDNAACARKHHPVVSVAVYANAAALDIISQKLQCHATHLVSESFERVRHDGDDEGTHLHGRDQILYGCYLVASELMLQATRRLLVLHRL